MKTLNLKIFAGLLILLQFGCDPCCWDSCCDDCYDDDCCNKRTINGRGEIISRTYNTDPFNSVVSVGIADVNIVKGDTWQVTLNAQHNILDVLTWEVRNNELILGIDEDVCIESSRGISIDIITSDIEQIISVGTGYIKVSGEKQGELFIRNTGTGCVNAYDLEVDTCCIVLTGTGSCKVDVNDLLDVTITGTGIVYYRGNPSVSSLVLGLGQIIKTN